MESACRSRYRHHHHHHQQHMSRRRTTRNLLSVSAMGLATSLRRSVHSTRICAVPSSTGINADAALDAGAEARASSVAGDAAADGKVPGSHSLRWTRVMLKVSGEALQGDGAFGIDPKVVRRVAKEVAAATMKGLQVAIVVGGGNFFRGRDAWEGLDHATADYIGMLATAMNAISLQSTLENLGVPVRVQTAIDMKEVAEPYIRRRAIRHLEKGRVVIFGGGTGNPFFTTDTAAALRAAEINAQAVLKATKVDGVYDDDPNTNPDAKLHSSLSYRDVVSNNLSVMDETAITLCKENNIPVVVFNINTEGNVTRALCGADIGTEVGGSSKRDIL